MVKALLAHRRVVTEHSEAARKLLRKEFGKKLPDRRVQLSFLESLYLVERKTLVVVDAQKKSVSFDRLLRLAKQGTKDFWMSYVVFRDLRNQGYVVKTGLRFGADFRVYAQTTKRTRHAKWIVHPVRESQTLTWREFSAKNRVAHSVQKHLLIAVVDDEEDVTYWDVTWLRRTGASQ